MLVVELPPFVAAQVVAIGCCQHTDAPVCARCCLRQRICYNVARCPLCNADQDEVCIVPPERQD